jgi:sphingomyelin phosphodiesterase
MVSPPLIHPKAQLTPAFWHNVTVAFEKNETLFNEYMTRKSRGWEVNKKCTDKCREDEICDLRAARVEDSCHTPIPGVRFSRRRREGKGRGSREEETKQQHNHNKHDECGASVSRDILSALVRRPDMLQIVQRNFLARMATVGPRSVE